MLDLIFHIMKFDNSKLFNFWLLLLLFHRKSKIEFWRNFSTENGVYAGRESFPTEFLIVEEQKRLNDIVYYFNDVISGI